MMKIDREKCIGCGLCIKDCFVRDIEMQDKKANIKNETCMKCGHCIAICPKEAVSTDLYNMDDVKNYNKEEFELDADKLLNFIKYRRSVRHFKNKDVEIDKISKIIEAGRFTQTGGNLQDVSYVVVKENIDELKSMVIETLKNLGEYILANKTPENMQVQKYAKMWLQMHDAFKENPKQNDMLFFNAPAVIIVVANSDVNGALASSNMELMTNALGLGTFFSGFLVRAASYNKNILDYLGIEEGKKIVTCMAVGYPDVKYSRTAPRKEADITWK